MNERIKNFFKEYKRVILIVLAAIFIIFIVFFSIPKKNPEAPPKEEEKQAEVSGGQILNQAVPLTEEDKTKSALNIVAKNFAEIYGSYSNQSNFQNIENVLPLLSVSYRQEMEAFLNNARVAYAPSAEYKGVTTVAMNVMVQSSDEATGVAEVLVQTQRAESSGTQANYTVKYQDLNLTLKKENGNWVVDKSEWVK